MMSPRTGRPKIDNPKTERITVRLSNEHNLKTAEYGEWYHDKSRYSSKEVDSFRYNDKAVEKFKTILE